MLLRLTIVSVAMDKGCRMDIDDRVQVGENRIILVCVAQLRVSALFEQKGES